MTQPVQTGRIFVGRQREMAGLRAAMDDAVAGRGRLVMLAGEPGIGKTRTAQELSVYAESAGAQVWWGSCHEQQGAPLNGRGSAGHNRPLVGGCQPRPPGLRQLRPSPGSPGSPGQCGGPQGWPESSRSHICSLRAFKDATAACPCSEVASQPDFYYEGDGVPGACIFVDGSDHLDPARQEKDTAARTALEDRGFRVITIRFDRPREEQVAQYSDVFGIGKS